MSVISKVRMRMLAMGAACTILGAAIGGGAAMAYQGHMFNALNDLQAARHELAVAKDNKGGHRDAAIGLVDQAIQQVNEGIQYAQ